MRPSEEIARLKARIAELEAWKESALAVEREWDEQAIAKLLGARLGESCRRVIAERVPILVKALKQIADEEPTGGISPACIAYMALRKAGMRK